MWSNAPVSGCMHVCVCACLLCRCGDRMSGRRSYIRLSVGLWFCRLVESFNISTEDCHLIMHPKQIYLARERREVSCKIKHFHAQIIISYPFSWHGICPQDHKNPSILKRKDTETLFYAKYDLKSFIITFHCFFPPMSKCFSVLCVRLVFVCETCGFVEPVCAGNHEDIFL